MKQEYDIAALSGQLEQLKAFNTRLQQQLQSHQLLLRTLIEQSDDPAGLIDAYLSRIDEFEQHNGQKLPDIITCC